jgi:hypothetical protein
MLGALLGIEDKYVAAAYFLCVASTVLCVIYGLIMWNRGGEEAPEQQVEDVRWAQEEKKVEEEL